MDMKGTEAESKGNRSCCCPTARIDTTSCNIGIPMKQQRWSTTMRKPIVNRTLGRPFLLLDSMMFRGRLLLMVNCHSRYVDPIR